MPPKGFLRLPDSCACSPVSTPFLIASSSCEHPRRYAARSSTPLSSVGTCHPASNLPQQISSVPCFRQAQLGVLTLNLSLLGPPGPGLTLPDSVTVKTLTVRSTQSSLASSSVPCTVYNRAASGCHSQTVVVRSRGSAQFRRSSSRDSPRGCLLAGCNSASCEHFPTQPSHTCKPHPFAPHPTNYIPIRTTAHKPQPSSHHSPQATFLRTTAHKPHPFAPQPTSHIPMHPSPQATSLRAENQKATPKPQYLHVELAPH